MSCCGQKRGVLSERTQPTAQTSARLPHREPGAAAHASGAGTVYLRALRGEACVVHGPRSGWKYKFSPKNPVQPVASQDASLLVATGLFAVER